MHSRRQNDCFSHCYFLDTARKVGDNYHFDCVSCNRFCYGRFTHFILIRKCAQSFEQSTTITVRVWVAVRDVNFVIVVAEGNLELKRVIVASAILLDRILIVGDIVAITVPAQPAVRCLFRAVEQRFLTLIVGAVWLDQINDGEFVLYILAHVRNAKVEPLCVGRRIVVVLENKVIAVGLAGRLDRPRKVT